VKFAVVLHLIAATIVATSIVVLSVVVKWFGPSIDASVLSVHFNETEATATISILNSGGGSDKLVDASLNANWIKCTPVAVYDANTMTPLSRPVAIPPRSNVTLAIVFSCPRPLQDTNTTIDLVFERTKIVRIERYHYPLVWASPPSIVPIIIR